MAREQWRSELGFLLAAVGSAIGLGNIWRFSYMAYEHGGGAFLIPYLTALFTAGIPVLILEYAIGHERIGSAPLAFAKISRRLEWIGWWPVCFVMFGILLYYNVIIAWCLCYLFFAFDLAWGVDPDHFFFKEFLKLSSGPGELGEVRTPILFASALVWLLCWLVIYRGVQRGIEIANKVLMPLLLIITAVLVFWSLTLEGASVGLKAYLKPDFSELSDSEVWIDAYSQIFFTLSLSFGIMITYASYLPERANITKMAVATAFINCGFSLFAGFAVFSVLGFMATSLGKPIGEVVSQSIGLAFVAYPKALSLMPFGNLFGALFFFCLVIAGLSSAVSIVEAFVAAMIDKFNYSRRALTNFACGVGLLGSMAFTTQAGLHWLDIVDHFLSHYGLVPVGILECLVIGWFFSLRRLQDHINRISSIKVGQTWAFLIRYFVPLMLLVILLGDLYRDIREPYGGHSWVAIIMIGRDWLLLTLVLALWLSSRKWRTQNHQKPGRTVIV